MRFATGFSTNNAADASQDLDGDGMSNVAEYIAGTDPTNPLSLLNIVFSATNSSVLQFVAQSNITYSVQTNGPLEILFSDGRHISFDAAGAHEGTL